MTDNKKIILQIKGLRLEAVRGGAVIVDNVDVALHAGEVLGLIGESGAGKSTIGLSAMAYARAGVHIAGGSVEIDGVDIRKLDANGRRAVRGRRIAYVAQSASAAFNPSHTIMDQVCEAPMIHGLMSRATCLSPIPLANAIRTRPLVANSSEPWRRWPCPVVLIFWCWTSQPRHLT